ncbi:hypothetical protein TW86_04230 [Halomonas sp. S2151]|nr:hypothetical protein TW86_04230 [Halomonas sp. S2151]
MAEIFGTQGAIDSNRKCLFCYPPLSQLTNSLEVITRNIGQRFSFFQSIKRLFVPFICHKCLLHFAK